MKIAKKRRGLIASIILSALVLSGCSLSDIKSFAKKNIVEPLKPLIDAISGNSGQKQEQKQEEKKEDDTPAVEKKDVSINIAMEDGKQFNEGEFVAPEVSVDPSSFVPTVTYYKGEQALAEAPQEVGDYKIVAKTEENDEYNAGLASKSFLIRKVPSISFFYGNENPLEADHQFDLALGDYNIYAKSSVEGANFTYSYLNSEGAELNGKPNDVGTYYIVANVQRTSTIGSASKSVRFRLVDSSSGVVAVDPVIKFFYKGSEACLESNWLIGGYADSQFADNEFDINDFSYTVEPANATYEETWTLDEQPIEAPTANPLAAGTYAVTITVTENEVAHALTKWAGFVIKSSEKVDPQIQFFYDGSEACTESNWINSGYADSQFDADQFDVTKLTYTVTPNLDAVVTWSLNEVACDAPSNPLAAGTWAMTVTVAESATNNEAVKWALFVIKESAPGKVDPQIQFFYDGQEKCLENNWLNSGYGDSQFFANEFDVTKLTYTVTPAAEAVVSWTLNDNPISAPTNPLAAGTYAMTVNVAASETVNAGVKWALFAIKEAAPGKVDPQIQFFYDGVEKCLENNWLNSGYGDSQFFANEFDVTKLTYTVTPEASAEVSWTLDEVEHAAPTNPLEAGTWAMTVSVAASDTVNAGVKWALFAIKEAAPGKVDPQIQFFYDGQEKCLENNWLNTGYGDTQFFASEFDVSKLTYTVTPEASAEVSWTLNEVEHAAPTNPLEAGTWAMTVTVAESETVNAGVKWALFAIKADKTDPVISFFYNDAQVCISGSHWFGEGYGDSQFYANEFDVTKLTYTVTPELEATVSWTLNEVEHAAPTNPLDAGTWAMTVSVAEGETNNAKVDWAIFAINEPVAPTPGTAELPYTISEAYSVFQGLSDGEATGEVYVEGYINSAPAPAVSGGRGQFRLTDGVCGTDLYVYNANDTSNAANLTLADIPVGGKAVVKGAIKNFSGTFELCYVKDQVNCQLAKAVEAPVITAVGAVTGPQEVAVNGTIDADAVTVAVTYSGIVQGTVKAKSVTGDFSATGDATAYVTIDGWNETLEFTVTVTSTGPVTPTYYDATMAAGSNSSTVTVNGNSAIKCGASSKAGVMTVTVASGATKLRIYIGGWNNDTGRTINVTVPSGVTISPTSINVVNESAFSGTATSFTVNDESIHLYEFTLSGVSSETTITFTANASSKNRFIAWGAQYAK